MQFHNASNECHPHCSGFVASSTLSTTSPQAKPKHPALSAATVACGATSRTSALPTLQSNGGSGSGNSAIKVACTLNVCFVPNNSKQTLLENKFDLPTWAAGSNPGDLDFRKGAYTCWFDMNVECVYTWCLLNKCNTLIHGADFATFCVRNWSIVITFYANMHFRTILAWGPGWLPAMTSVGSLHACPSR